MEKIQSELDKVKAEFETLSKKLEEKEELVKKHLASFPPGVDQARDEEEQKLELDRDSIYFLVREAQQRLFKLQKSKN